MSGVRGMGRSDLLQLAIAAKLSSLHVAFPARVVAYSAEHQTVDVEPALQRSTKTLEGSLLREDLPIVCGVPIAWPRSGAYGVTFPLEVDDTVLVVVCDRNIGEWRRTGERGDPRDAGVHGLDGAVAVPGLYPRGGIVPSGGVETDGLRLGGLASNAPRIVVDGSTVVASAGGTDQLVALENLVSAQLSRLKTAIAGAVPVANDGGANLQSTLLAALNTPPAWPESVAATVLRAE